MAIWVRPSRPTIRRISIGITPAPAITVAIAGIAVIAIAVVIAVVTVIAVVVAIGGRIAAKAEIAADHPAITVDTAPASIAEGFHGLAGTQNADHRGVDAWRRMHVQRHGGDRSRGRRGETRDNEQAGDEGQHR
jgi:hypothetical protein